MWKLKATESGKMYVRELFSWEIQTGLIHLKLYVDLIRNLNLFAGSAHVMAPLMIPSQFVHLPCH